ncbi:MAG: chloride channel protein [Cyanobacteria bacterium TGS_CYA1]|nr:chloride channel protein [Cyanobacteria bacterium TGS_CYA1]
MKILKSGNTIPVLEAGLIGIIAGLSAEMLSFGVSWLGSLRMTISNVAPPYLILPALGLFGGFVAGLMVEILAPEASGSGIPQVRARLDRIIIALDFRVALVKLIGGTIALGTGFFLGREGPTVQLGASLAAPLTARMSRAREYKRQLIAAGAAAGLTAAFNAPLAGVVFVLEELLREVRYSTILLSVVSCSMACLVLNLFNSPHLRHDIEPIASQIHFAPQDIPFYILLGILCGLLGAFFNVCILKTLKINRDLKKVPTSFKVAIAGLLSGLLISLLPAAFHNYAGMRILLSSGATDWTTALLAFPIFFILTVVAYGSGAPGGLFAPSLTLGSAIGFLVGYLEHLCGGGLLMNSFALVGMGAFVAGVTRTPLTAIVITFEMTANFTLLTPLMITSVISSTVGDLVFRDGLYEHLMRWNGIHLHGDRDEKLRELTVKDIMRKNNDFVRSNAFIKDLLPTLSANGQKDYPVFDEKIFVGILRQTDLASLKNKESITELKVSDIMLKQPLVVSPFDTLEELMFLFSRYKYSWLPVVHGDKFKGIILQSDVVQALFSRG